MRKLIAGMKISADEKVNTDDGDADWVEGWSDDYGMMSQVDACVLGMPATSPIGPGYRTRRTSRTRKRARCRRRARVKALFATTKHRRWLELRTLERLPDNRLSLIYGIG